jgi:hypothetical protein
MEVASGMGRGREEDKQGWSGAERRIFQAEMAHHVHQLHLDITGSTCVWRNFFLDRGQEKYLHHKFSPLNPIM